MATSSHKPFLLGVNYPWLDYAEDFGAGPRGHLGVSTPRKYELVRKDFVRLKECGVRVVRWFLFGDGRGGFLTRNGIPWEADEFLLKDVAAALQLAHAHEIKLCFSLIDYLWLQDREPPYTNGGGERVLQFAAGREAFLQNILIPMFREFRAHPALFAWEVANEPEWAINRFHRKTAAKIPLSDFRSFARETVQAIHEFGHSAATLGSARLLWLGAWSELNLDFYQAHYYPSGERGLPSLAQQLSGLRPLNKPLWLGELPAHDPSKPDYSLEDALTQCREAGLSGAAIWRWTTPESTGSDLSIGTVEPARLKLWQALQRPHDLTV